MEVDASANAQQPGPATAGASSSAVGTVSLRPTAVCSAALLETDTRNSPLSDPPPPANPRPASPTEPSTHDAPTNQELMVPSHPDRRVSSRGSDLPNTINGLPMNGPESVWMRSKGTLKYFREVNKMGKLSDLVLHWYQLERALGFPESVSFLPTYAMRKSADT